MESTVESSSSPSVRNAEHSGFAIYENRTKELAPLPTTTIVSPPGILDRNIGSRPERRQGSLCERDTTLNECGVSAETNDLSSDQTKPYLPMVPTDECVATSEDVRNALKSCNVGIVESNCELYLVRHATKDLAATNLIPLDSKNRKCQTLIRACVRHTVKKTVSNRILIEAVAVSERHL